MRFCKKRHKVVIKVVTKDTNLDRICKCDGTADILVNEPLARVIYTRGENRCGSKRRVNKSLTDSAVNAAFLNYIKERNE